MKHSPHKDRKFPVASVLSKNVVITNNIEGIKNSRTALKRNLHKIFIREKSHKIFVAVIDRVNHAVHSKNFTNANQKNLSEILFPTQTKNLNKRPLIINYYFKSIFVFKSNKTNNIHCKWIYFLKIVAEKMNATLNFIEIILDKTDRKSEIESKKDGIRDLLHTDYDFFLNGFRTKSDLESYNYHDWCFIAPLPEPYPIFELILFLPLDKSCWMWLGITAATLTFIWRMSEGHWNFFFGVFAYFVGQSFNIRT